jgi:hypothetical protein
VASGVLSANECAASTADSLLTAAPGPPLNGSRRASSARPRITPALVVVADYAGRVAEVGEDLLGGDPDLLGMEFEAEWSHDGLQSTGCFAQLEPFRRYNCELHDAT